MTNQISKSEAIKFYQKNGLNLLPLKPRNKEPLIEWGYLQIRKATEQEIIQWFSGTKNNIGIICGKISDNLRVVDVDNEEIFQKFYELFKDKSPIVKTARGGQLYFKSNDNVKNSKLCFMKDKESITQIDVQAENKYVVAPPSIHPSGKQYEFISMVDIPVIDNLFVKIKSIAEDIATELGLKVYVPNEEQIDIDLLLQGVADGQRNDSAIKIATYYRKQNKSKEEVLQLLNEWNNKNTTPLSESEIKNVCESAFKTEKPYSFKFRERKHEIKYEPITIEQALEIVEKNFPNMRYVYEACLSTVATLLLEDSSDPVGLNLIGAPSSEKTTIISFFYGIDGITFKTDNFTPKSFVTHASNVKEKELQNIDLLPKIKDKCLLVPELAPIFGKRKEDLVENLSILTRVFDGEGLETDSGVRGHRGYTGKYLFAWIGASTPLPNHVWKAIGKLGARWLFLGVRNKNKKENELLAQLTDESYSKKLYLCRDVTHRLIHTIWQKNGGVRSVKWDKAKDENEARLFIVYCAQLLRKLRAPIEIWSEQTQDGNIVYNYSTPLIEEPERAINLLYDLAKGHAIIHGRKYITLADMPLIFDVMCSSMPYDRLLLFKLLVDNDILTPKKIATQINCHERHARRVLEMLRILGVVKLESLDSEQDVGRPLTTAVLTDEYSAYIKYLKLQIGKADIHWQSDVRNSEHIKSTRESHISNIRLNNFGQETDTIPLPKEPTKATPIQQNDGVVVPLDLTINAKCQSEFERELPEPKPIAKKLDITIERTDNGYKTQKGEFNVPLNRILMPCDSCGEINDNGHPLEHAVTGKAWCNSCAGIPEELIK